MNCDKCNTPIVSKSDFTTGYGTNDKGEKVCYACCANEDIAYMQENDKISLYLTQDDIGFTVSNWPGSLKMKAQVTTGRHNMGLTRYDASFTDPSGNKWYGRKIGDNTDLVHCKKRK